MTLVQLVVPGEPCAKGRPRFTRQGHAYTPKKTETAEATIYDTPEDEVAANCPDCGGVGWSVEDRWRDDYCWHVAVYCACAKGQKMRQGHADYMRREHSAGRE